MFNLFLDFEPVKCSGKLQVISFEEDLYCFYFCENKTFNKVDFITKPKDKPMTFCIGKACVNEISYIFLLNTPETSWVKPLSQIVFEVSLASFILFLQISLKDSRCIHSIIILTECTLRQTVTSYLKFTLMLTLFQFYLFLVWFFFFLYNFWKD